MTDLTWRRAVLVTGVAGGLMLPSGGARAAVQPAPGSAAPAGLFAKEAPSDVRVMTLNVGQNSLFSRSAADTRQQRHVDAITRWIRDAKTPGGNVDVVTGTPVVVLGDLNVYDDGPTRHLAALVAGRVSLGADSGQVVAPDWDGTALEDALPLHNTRGPET